MARAADSNTTMPTEAPKINIIYGSDEETDVCEITCMVCAENKVRVSFQCGHLLCISCANKMELCPMCKKQIKQRTKLFI